MSTKTETEDGRVHYDTVYYTPSEFFGPDGAMVPDYNPEDYNQTTGYYFSDTSCTTDDWVLEAEMQTTGNFGSHITLGLSAFFEPVFDWRDFRSFRPAPMERRIEIPVEVKPKSLLRDERLTMLSFEFHDGILYFYRDGDMYKKQAYDICRINDVSIYWSTGGGAIKSLRFQDNTNNKTYYEDFSDCKNMQLFEDCPPPPKVELRARVELPTCQDPTLRFYSESNLLEDFHWVDPYGREFSREQNPVITNLSSLKSGTYWGWGKYDRCSEPVAVRVDVEIVEPELVSDTVELVSCASENLYIGGKLVTEDGFYSDTVRTKNGYCDSVTVYNVYLLQPKLEKVELEICEGTSIEYKGRTYNKAGVYEYSEKSKIMDCDSVYYQIEVKEHPSYFTIQHRMICSDEAEEGRTQTGVYTDSLTSEHGCDSVMVLDLVVFPKPPVDTFLVLSCEGQVEVAGRLVTEEGYYSDTLLAKDGFCDSIRVYDVKFIHPTNEDVDLEICEGGSISFRGKNYTAGGTYSDVAKSELYGCDSVFYTINVKENPTYLVNRYDTICGGEELDGHTETGVYTHSFSSINGCDSVVVYHLQVLWPQTVVVDLEICEGDSVPFNGKFYKAGGSYADTLPRKNYACDSIQYEIRVKEHSSYFVARYDTICWGESLEGYTVTGVYTDSLTTVNGCDSVLQLNLEVLPEPKTDTLRVIACEEEEVLVDGRRITEDGFYAVKRQTVIGNCDSTVVYDVRILRPVQEERDFEICGGDSVLFNGKVYKSGGTYADALPRKNYACDSIQYEIRIKEHPSYFIARYDSICWGESLDGHTETGVYTDSLTTVNGCDSILQLNLNVYHRIDIDTVEVVACEGDELLVEGKLVTEDGYYSENLLAANGKCDSVTVYEVRILRPTQEDRDFVICAGDSVSFNGKTYKKGGAYTDVLLRENYVCDSIQYEIRVKEHPSYLIARYDTICWEKSFKSGGAANEAASDEQIVSGIYPEQYTTVNGCDSVIEVHFEVLPKIVGYEDVVICEGDVYSILDQELTESGEYEVNLGSVGRCDSFVVVRLQVDPAFSLTKPEDVVACGRAETQLQVDSIPSAQYSWRPPTFLSAADRFNPFVSTPMDISYLITARRGACVDSTTLSVQVNPIPAIDHVDLSPEKKEIVINPVRMSSDYSYSLDGEQWQSSPSFVDDIPVGTSLAYIKDLYGCESSLPFYFLIPIYPEDHMSPNGDGIKDTWEVENLGYYKHYSVRIYDRYGKLLVEYHDEYPGWDGVYNGADMPSTDYWYVISVDELDYEVSGHFTLLRR
ncbi:MAG: T9SS type B sorting domain-containing protein [Paludibacteraceae bacterium]|nr:T9SS type B sorting domain-containing protein [Paludibacteraceae bacterium]